MASSTDFKTLRGLFAKLTVGQVASLLDEALLTEGHEGVRQWMAGDDDPNSEAAAAGKALLLSSEAASICDVERQRINRWEKEGRIKRAVTTPSGPLFWRKDVELIKVLEDERGSRRSRGVAEEPIS